MDEKQNSYKLILVDDEDEVRGRISSRISGEGGFRVVGTAGNGHDALELIDEHSPHVVITDIRMPFIDGIKLAGIIKREYPTIRVVFITGYDEFDYAREAVSLGVRSYLTKPLTQGDISRFLSELKVELDEEFRRSGDLQLLRECCEDSLPLLIDNCFASFLSTGGEGGKNEIDSLAGHGVVLEGRPGVLALVHVEQHDAGPDVFRREADKIAVRTAMRNILRRRGIEHHHFVYHERVVFIIFNGSGLPAADLDEALMEAVQTSRMYFSANIDIGVSSTFEGFGKLRTAWLEAKRVLTDSRFLNTGRIVYARELLGRDFQPVAMDSLDLRDIEYALRFGSDEDLTGAVSVLRTKLAGETSADFRFYMINLLHVLIGFSSSIGMDMNEVYGGDVLDVFTTVGSVRSMFDWFENLALKLREHNSRQTVSNSGRLLENALAYMRRHYEDSDLNMERTCESVGISVSYLSLLFKKHTGKTFVKCLTEIRLEKARELLKYSGQRIIDVAETCGYRDVHYFSHSFKKFVGMPPKKYREEQRTD